MLVQKRCKRGEVEDEGQDKKVAGAAEFGRRPNSLVPKAREVLHNNVMLDLGSSATIILLFAFDDLNWLHYT